MSATFQFSESNTVGETVADGISNLNMGSNDSPNLNVSTYPITRGNSSFEKYIRAKFTGSFTTISNMLFWKSNGALVAGEVITCGYNLGFTQPSQVTNGDSSVPVTSGGSTAVQSSSGSSTISAPGYTKYLRLQLQTSGSTPSGSVNQKTFTFQWDEV